MVTSYANNLMQMTLTLSFKCDKGVRFLFKKINPGLP